jgi:hypothetical protein
MAIAVPVSGSFDIETYGGLKDWIASELDRGDLEAQIPNFIRLCEYTIDRRLLHVRRETTLAINITGETYTLPSDFRQLTSIHLMTDPAQQIEMASSARLSEGFKGTGQPLACSVENGLLRFGPSPDADYTARMTYLKAFNKLSDVEPTNWILQNHADIYVYGSLLQGEAYLVNDERLPLWKLAFEEVIRELNEAGVRYRHSGSPMRLASPVCV